MNLIEIVICMILHTIWYISHQESTSNADVSSISNTFNHIFSSSQLKFKFFFYSMICQRRYNHLNHNLLITMLDILPTFTSLHNNILVNLVFNHLQYFHMWIIIITRLHYCISKFPTRNIFTLQPHLFSTIWNMFTTSIVTSPFP